MQSWGNSDCSMLVGVLLFISLLWFLFSKRSHPRCPPVIPGLPIIGNLLQLREKKVHRTFARWADKYGAIYTIKMGVAPFVIINSSDLAKEAMVSRFSSISGRKLASALQVITSNKFMVSMSDFGEEYKQLKRYLLTSVLGAAPQKRFRPYRDELVKNLIRHLRNKSITNPQGIIMLRDMLILELVGLALKKLVGKDLETIYVNELGVEFSRLELYQILVGEPMSISLEHDWRDFFPSLRWVPNKKFERKIQDWIRRKEAVVKALMEDHEKKHKTLSVEEPNCYLEFLVKEAKELSEKQLGMLIWEGFLLNLDTTILTIEWAMFELAKEPKCQERLYKEIKEVCGTEKASEEHLPHLPYLNAIFHETTRKHPPAPILPTRYAHEDTQIGGYHIPAGSQIVINIYACNMREKEWEDAERWKPERFLTESFEVGETPKTLSFGAGKRVCIGIPQVTVIACVSIARFVQEFEWALAKGDAGDENSLSYTSQKLSPLEAIITPRAV